LVDVKEIAIMMENVNTDSDVTIEMIFHLLRDAGELVFVVPITAVMARKDALHIRMTMITFTMVSSLDLTDASVLELKCLWVSPATSTLLWEFKLALLSASAILWKEDSPAITAQCLFMKTVVFVILAEKAFAAQQ
jgi:hypothetical protein